MILEGATAATAADISSTLTALKAVATFMFEALGDIVSIVVANPLLMIPIGVVLTYSIISVFRRLF